jgi:hypothetical protein
MAHKLPALCIRHLSQHPEDGLFLRTKKVYGCIHLRYTVSEDLENTWTGAECPKNRIHFFQTDPG